MGDADSLYARTNAEAHLYMDLTPCACGDPVFERHSTDVSVGDLLYSQYTGACRTCGAARRFVFEQPETFLGPKGRMRYGGDDSSRLLDPGEWMMVADYHAKLQPGTRADLEIAAAAIEEVLKFIPARENHVPDNAFRSERGRAVRDAERGRFRRPRLEVVRDTYLGLLARAFGGA